MQLEPKKTTLKMHHLVPLGSHFLFHIQFLTFCSDQYQQTDCKTSRVGSETGTEMLEPAK